MPSDAPYRWIFIDWHGTLSHSRFWEGRDDLASLSAAIFAPGESQHDLLLPWMRGLLTSEQVVRSVAQDLSIDADDALAALIASCRAMRIPATILAAVADLRARGFLVAIATDNINTFRRWTVPSLGLHRQFDAILSSADRKALKWDRDDAGQSRFFGSFLAQERIGRGESVLLDDSPDAARQIEPFGIACRHITSPESLLAELRALARTRPV